MRCLLDRLVAARRLLQRVATVLHQAYKVGHLRGVAAVLLQHAKHGVPLLLVGKERVHHAVVALYGSLVEGGYRLPYPDIGIRAGLRGRGAALVDVLCTVAQVNLVDVYLAALHECLQPL